MPNYDPNSFGGPSGYREPPLRLEGDADRYNHREDNDDYMQPRALYRLMSDAQQGRLVRNIAGSMVGVPETIVQRAIGHFAQVEPAYAEGIAHALADLNVASEAVE